MFIKKFLLSFSFLLTFLYGVDTPQFQSDFDFNTTTDNVREQLMRVTASDDGYYYDYSIYKNGDRTTKLLPSGEKTLLTNNFVVWKFNVSNLEAGKYDVLFRVYAPNDKNNLLVTKTETFTKINTLSDSKPTIQIVTPEDQNPKKGNFDVYVSASDDKELKYIHWAIRSLGGGTGDKVVVSGKSVNNQKLTITPTDEINDGEQVVSIYSEDSKGQYSDEVSYKFINNKLPNQETEKPIVTILTPETKTPSNSSISIKIKITDNKALKKITISYNGKDDVYDIEGKELTDFIHIDIKNVPSGNQKIMFQAEDEAGNLSDAVYYNYIKGIDGQINVSTKNCSEINYNEDDYDSYWECKKETNIFSLEDKVYNWFEFHDLEDKDYVLKWKFIETNSNTIKEYTTNFTWDEYEWYRGYQELLEKKAGDWKVEIYLDNKKVKETTFKIEETPFVLNTTETLPRVINSEDSITFKFFLMPHTKIIKSVNLHYRKKGTSLWSTEIVLDEVEGWDSTVFNKTHPIFGKKGFYEFEVQIKYVDNNDDKEIKTSKWLSTKSSSFEISNLQLPPEYTGMAGLTHYYINKNNTISTGWGYPANKFVTQAKFRYKNTNTGNDWVELDQIFKYKKDTYFRFDVTFNIKNIGFYKFEAKAKGSVNDSGVPFIESKWKKLSSKFVTKDSTTAINGECGSANNHLFSSSSSSYGNKVQCSSGRASDFNFPQDNSIKKWNWTCEGIYNGNSVSCSASREVKTTNEPPTLTTKSITPNKIKSGENITFTTTWNDPENKSIVDVKVRYRKQGSSNWTTNVMSHKSGYTFEKEKAITGTAGIYEVEFMAKDADTPNGERTNDTGWLDGGSFEIEADTVVIPPVVTPTELPILSLNQDINFGKSTTRSLNVTNRAKIKLEVKNGTEIQVNFDGIGSYEDSKTITSDGVYEFSYLFKKSDYTSDSSDFWKKDLTFTATAYNSKGASNVVTSGKFTVYDLDEYHEYLAKLKAQQLFEDKKKKEEERARLEAEREAQLEDRQQVNQDIESISDEYSDRAKEDLDTIKNIDSQEDCAWLNRDGNCIPIYKDKNGEYTYSEKYEESKYSYTIKVKYYKYTSSYFPANVRLESNNNENALVMYSDKLAQNPKHLQVLVAQLIEQYKNRIDSQKALIDLPLDTEEYSFLLDNQEGETRTGAGFTDSIGNTVQLDIPLDEDKKNRIANAFTKAWEAWSDEIYDSAVKAQGSLSLVFDSDTSGLEKAENVSRATYQVSLGALKAIYGALGGLIYGAGEDEINSAFNSIKGYTQEEFEKLSEEQQAIILDKIHSSVEYINADPERKASFETATIMLGSNIRVAKNITKSARNALKTGKATKAQLLRNSIQTTKTTVVRSFKSFKKLLLSGKLKKFKGTLEKTPKNEVNLCKQLQYNFYKPSGGCIFVPTYRGFISKSKILQMNTFVLIKKKYQKLLDQLVKNGDPKGDLVEGIAKLYFKEHFKEFKLYDGMYSGNQGFDMIYIKGTLDNIQDIIIVEAKQISKGGSSKLTFNKRIEVTQMTDDWIELTAKKLSGLGGDKAKFADYIIKNPKKIKKLFVSVDKNPNSMNYKHLIMGKITFK